MNIAQKTFIHCINTDVLKFCQEYSCDIYDFTCEVLDQDQLLIDIN